MTDILQEFDDMNDVSAPSGAHHRPNITKEKDMMIKVLRERAVFKQLELRKHESFPKVKVLLHSLKNEDLDYGAHVISQLM